MNKLKLLAVLPLAAGTVMLGAQAANAAASVTLSPSSGPAGTSVSVKLSGFPAGKPVAVLQCKTANPTPANAQSACNTAGVALGTADSSGSATVSLKIDASWCASATSCPISGAVADPSDTNPADRAEATFTLASGSSSGGSSSGSGSSSGGSSSGGSTSGGSASTGSGSTTTDPAVNAGTGGTADREGIPAGVIAIAAIGAVAVAGGAVRFARR